MQPNAAWAQPMWPEVRLLALEAAVLVSSANTRGAGMTYVGEAIAGDAVDTIQPHRQTEFGGFEGPSLPTT